MIDRAVLTIATGKPIYIQMAVNLARSFKWWHKNSDIKFLLATDQAHLIPSDLSDIQIIELQPNQYGQGFSPKLYLDKLSPADKTLFIDADCLCFAPLESVFARFEGHTVSVIGKTIVEGDFFGDVRAIRQRFSLDYLPYFVGGIYYFEKSDLCTQIFDFARSIELKYDEIGLIRLRGRPNEEPLMAIAMSVHGQTPLLEDGTVKAEPMFYPSGIVVDVIKGYASLYNHKHDHCHSKVWGISESNPKIVHFHCSNIERYQYKSECFKLQKVIIEKWNYNLANMYAWLRFAIPELMIKSFKRMFRPLYQKFFGVRSIRKSERIV